jgi:dTDP-4-dehydrorhamnose 3,5-epimerase
MTVKFTKQSIPEVVLVEPAVFADSRGYFMESFNQKNFDAGVGGQYRFVQDNESHSSQGVLRGLHYQLKHPQGKLVRVTLGAVFDVAVDLRKSAATFGKWVGCLLSAQNKSQLWIPPGFAHGFLVLSPQATFEYKVTDFRYAEDERSLNCKDPRIGIVWPEEYENATLGGWKLSEKDAGAQGLNEIEVYE